MAEIRATEATLRLIGVITAIGFVPTNPRSFFRCVATDTGRRFYLAALPGIYDLGL